MNWKVFFTIIAAYLGLFFGIYFDSMFADWVQDQTNSPGWGLIAFISPILVILAAVIGRECR